MVTFIKEYTVGEIIADTFRIYVRHLGPLFLICLVPMAPFELLRAVGAATYNEALTGISTLLSIAAGAFVYGAVTVAVSDICLGNPPTLKRSYAAVGRVLGRYIGTYALVMLMMIVGLVLLLVPGIIAMVFFLFALPVVTIERKRVVESLKRSIELGKEYYWRNLGLLVIAGLIAVLVMAVVFLAIVIAALIMEVDPNDFGFSIVMSLANIFTTPLLQIPLVLLYYDMRVRKEYFDGSALAQEMFA